MQLEPWNFICSYTQSNYACRFCFTEQHLSNEHSLETSEMKIHLRKIAWYSEYELSENSQHGKKNDSPLKENILRSFLPCSIHRSIHEKPRLVW